MTKLQICAQWFFKAQNKAFENLIRNTWIVCGYKGISDLEYVGVSNNTDAKYSRAEIIKKGYLKGMSRIQYGRTPLFS